MKKTIHQQRKSTNEERGDIPPVFSIQGARLPKLPSDVRLQKIIRQAGIYGYMEGFKKGVLQFIAENGTFEQKAEIIKNHPDLLDYMAQFAAEEVYDKANTRGWRSLTAASRQFSRRKGG